METDSQSRRKFITALGLLLGGTPLLWRYLTPRSMQLRPVLARAAMSDVPPYGALVFRDERVALLRDGEGLYALSLVCTHLGCTVAMSDQEIACPCHGSRFDRQGNVLTGPAERPLKRLRVEVREGFAEVLSG